MPARPSGNSTAAALRRLARDRPDLHARVVAGSLTASAAAQAAGFRQPMLSLPRDPLLLARALVRHLDPAELDALVAFLGYEPRRATTPPSAAT
jgi:hypothetical protein